MCCNFFLSVVDQLLVFILISVFVFLALRLVSYPITSSSSVLEEGDLVAMDCLDVEGIEANTIVNIQIIIII